MVWLDDYTTRYFFIVEYLFTLMIIGGREGIFAHASQWRIWDEEISKVETLLELKWPSLMEFPFLNKNMSQLFLNDFGKYACKPTRTVIDLGIKLGEQKEISAYKKCKILLEN